MKVIEQKKIYFCYMKERKLQIITFLMLLTVIGLISIQIYWINNAYSIEEIRFEEDMRKILAEINKKIEKREAAKLIFEKFDKGKDNFVFISGDSIDFKWNNNNKPPKLPNRKITVKIDSDIVNLSDKQFKIIKRINDDSNKVNQKVITNKKIDSLIIGKRKLVTEVVEELITINPKRKNPYDKHTLDSLINLELKNRNLDINFAFGIMSPNGDFVLLSDASKESQLRKSRIRIALLPGEFFRPPDFLVIDFAKKSYLIVKSISWILLLSVFLIGLIIYLFYKTVKMFLLQKKANDVKNDLINNVTHEFKTPISTISLACDVINEDIATKNVNAKYIEMIREENNKLALLVENLLSIATLEKGELVLNKEKFLLEDVLEKITDKFNLIAETRNGKVVFENNFENIPVHADKFHLTSAISNILDNAIKYSKENPEVYIRVKIVDGFIQIEITDNGIGISKSELKNIFDTFYRVPSGNIHNTRGNGIGLSYAKKIVELHNGTISVNSKLNAGSTFIISLPYDQ